MMWKSYFRVQNFFSSFLNVPIFFDSESETFQVSPCNTVWRKIKRFLLTNLCLFAIWGVSIYRLSHQLLTSAPDPNFNILDVVIISIALAFCTEGLAHIWTFHFCAYDICYVLTQTLKLTTAHCHESLLKMRGRNNIITTTDERLDPSKQFQNRIPDFSLKSVLQWEHQMHSLKRSFISSKYHLSKEELIMYAIAVGFNGVPLVCLLTPLMTSSDPASYLMNQIVFPNSPILAMLAASFFQGLTAFYASLLSLNLILICLTIFTEIGSVLRCSYPTGSSKQDSVSNVSNASAYTILGNNDNSGSSRVSGVPSGYNEIFEKVQHCSVSRSGKRLEVRIDNYDNKDADFNGSRRAPSPVQAGCEKTAGKFSKSGLATEKEELEFKQKSLIKGRKKLEPESCESALTTITIQVLSAKLNNQLVTSSSLPSTPPSSPINVAHDGDASGSGKTRESIPWQSCLRAPSPSVLMMKIMEELEPTVVVPKPASSNSLPGVKKLLCPPPSHRIKSSVEVLFTKSFRLYRQTKLLVRFINSAMFYYFPVVISVGMVLATLSAYSTVKLHSLFPLPIRLSIVLIGLTITTVMWLLMMESTEITRHSDEFLRHWRGRLRKEYTRKQLRSCQTLCFRIGPFLDFKKDSIFGIFSTIQHCTVNLAVIPLRISTPS